MSKLEVGEECPVYWETFDGRPAGSHKARILAVQPYKGKFPQHFTHTLTVAAPTMKRGSTEICVHESDFAP